MYVLSQETLSAAEMMALREWKSESMQYRCGAESPPACQEALQWALPGLLKTRTIVMRGPDAVLEILHSEEDRDRKLHAMGVLGGTAMAARQDEGWALTDKGLHCIRLAHGVHEWHFVFQIDSSEPDADT